jgi:hypothetical protein
MSWADIDSDTPYYRVQYLIENHKKRLEDEKKRQEKEERNQSDKFNFSNTMREQQSMMKKSTPNFSTPRMPSGYGNWPK